VSRPDGSRLLYAPRGRLSAQNPAYSPDGAQLLITLFHGGYNEGTASLAKVSSRGGRPHTVIQDAGGQSVNLPGAAWNPTTRRITFASDRGGGPDEIWTANADGTNPLQVTRHESREHVIEPSFSPDGRWLVFESVPEGPEERVSASIWKVPAAGGAPTRLTAGRRFDDRQPNWSPRGDRIVFQRRRARSHRWKLMTMRPDGTDVRRVTTGHGSDTDASWSPDGRRIVYSSDRGGLAVANLFAVPAAGGAPLRVTRDRRHYSGAPSWSPDGRWIAYESSRSGRPDSPTAIWRIRAP
jgi:TolB protein